MIPKVASNLLHFNVQRIAAAVQSQTTYTLKQVWQFQPQAQAQAAAASTPAASSTTTNLGWNAFNGAAGPGANAGGAKFNAGGRFYNAFQNGGISPDGAAVSSTQHEDEEKNSSSRTNRSINSLSRLRRNTASNGLIPAIPDRIPSSLSLQYRNIHRLTPRVQKAIEPAPADGSQARSASTIAQQPQSEASVDPSLDAKEHRVPLDPTDPSAPQSVTTPFTTSYDHGPKYKNVHDVQAALNQFRLKKNSNPDDWSQALHSLVLIWKKDEPLTEVVNVYNEMLDRGISPSGRAVNSLIFALCHRDLEIQEKLQRLDRWEFQFSPERTPENHEEIKALLMKEDNYAPAMALVAATYAQQVPPSLGIACYNILLEAAAAHADVPRAIQVYAHLERTATLPNARTFAMLIKAYANANDLSGALEVFSEFRAASQRGGLLWYDQDPEIAYRHKADPSQPLSPAGQRGMISVWNQMLSAYLSNGDSEGALELLERMMDSPTKLNFTAVDVPSPSARTFYHIIHGFCDMGDVATALTWHKRLMEQVGGPPETDPNQPILNPCRPDHATWTAIVVSLYEKKMVDEMNELWMAGKALGHEDTAPSAAFCLWLWRLNVMMIGDSATEPAKAKGYLDFIREQIVDPGMELEWTLRASRHRDRAWQAVGLYMMQGRVDEGLQLALSIDRKDRAVVHDPDAPVTAQVADALTRLRTTFEQLEKTLLEYCGEITPSFPILIDYLRAHDKAGLLPTQRAAWYYTNSLLKTVEHSRGLQELKPSDWIILAQVFSSTCQSVFWETGKPIPNEEAVWQLNAFFGLLKNNKKTLANIGNHNVNRIYHILQHHLGEAKAHELFLSLGPGFSNYETYLPKYVKMSKTINQPTPALVQETRPADFESSSPIQISHSQTKLLKFAQQKGKPANDNLASAAFDRFVDGMKRGQAPTPEEAARLIITLGQVQALDKVREVYRMAQSIIAALATNQTWQRAGWFAIEDAMVCALSHCGDIDNAANHRSRIVEQQGVPSPNAYGALISNIKDSTDNAGVAIELFEESRRLGVVPNEYLYNTVISRLAKARKTDQALALFEEMQNMGLRPTEVTYGAVIGGCARIGNIEMAETLFTQMTENHSYTPRIPPLNTMMQLYCYLKPNRAKVMHYYDILKAYGLKPTAYTYKILLDAHGTINPIDVQGMRQVFETLRASPIPVDGTHVASMITALGCASNDLEASLTMLRECETDPTLSKTLPDALVYEAIFNVTVHHKRYDLMEQLHREMKARKIKPLAYVYNPLIKGYANAGMVERARELFESMADPAAGAAAPDNRGSARRAGAGSRIAGDLVYREPSTWETMIRAEISVGEHQRALALVERLKARFYPPAVTAKIQAILFDPRVGFNSDNVSTATESTPITTPRSHTGDLEFDSK